MTSTVTEDQLAPGPALPATSDPVPDSGVELDLLVEDVSIDGMCGVY